MKRVSREGRIAVLHPPRKTPVRTRPAKAVPHLPHEPRKLSMIPACTPSRITKTFLPHLRPLPCRPHGRLRPALIAPAPAPTAVALPASVSSPSLPRAAHAAFTRIGPQGPPSDPTYCPSPVHIAEASPRSATTHRAS